jgi:acyl-coenzyme A synthetase/AMP-(fatty) acid ligase
MWRTFIQRSAFQRTYSTSSADTCLVRTTAVVPSYSYSIEFVEALPKTATGKILKKNLRKKYWAAQTNVSPEFAPRK